MVYVWCIIRNVVTLIA